MQPQKEIRATTSCTECQRRKQKCSREWPCNHCQARKVAHLCQFSAKKLQQDLPTDSRETSSDSRGQKRSFPDSTDAPLPSQDDDPEEFGDGLKIWGYMPGHVHWKVGSMEENHRRKDSPPNSTSSNEVDKVLCAIPPRSITDAFVNHFLSVVNYRYTSIYGPTFTDQYVQWWADRAVGKRLSPEFTCLLLRVCAYSVQYLTTALRKMIEFELACSSQVLTERFSSAAEQLSQSFEASNTSIERVQELFLKGAWLKSESKIVESWHALSRTIREAQELGIDRDANIEGLSEFDIEIRRRVWALLYIWDWQMSSWLGRPNLIDQKNLNFKLPNLRLDQSVTEPNLLSPFAHMALQAKLGRRLATAMGGAQSVNDMSADEILAVESECKKFFEELPPIFRVEDPDTSFDEQHPYFVFQRHQMHTIIYVTMLDFLKPFLTRDRHDRKTELDDEFRKRGVDIALCLLKVSRKLFDHEFPINAKFHMVVFSIFDTATILCSAIVHDRDRVIPRRKEIITAIGHSLEMLHQLELSTKLGAASYTFLHKLVQATPELSPDTAASKRQRQSSSTSVDISIPPPLMTASSATSSISSSEPTLPPMSTFITSMVPEPASEDQSFDLEQFLAQNPFGSSSNFDMGGLEQVWDWGDLNLEGQPL